MRLLVSLIVMLVISFQSFGSAPDFYDVMWDLAENYTYEDDTVQFGTGDYWQEPYELRLNKKGDCEDFSLYIRETLKPNKQYKVIAYAIFYLDLSGRFSGHSISIVEDKVNNKIFLTDNTYYTEIKDITNHIKIIEYWMNPISVKMLEICQIRNGVIYGKQNLYTSTINLKIIKRYRRF